MELCNSNKCITFATAMRCKRKHMVFVLLMLLLLTGQAVAASSRSDVPVLPLPSEQTALTTPAPAAATMDRIEITCPSSPYTLLARQRRTLSHVITPTPLCHAQRVLSYKHTFNNLHRWCALRYERVVLTSAHIAYPFTAFW